MPKQQRKAGVKVSLRIDEPTMYDVILLNDDFTTMQFVVDVLMHIFHHSQMSAEQLMLKIHKEGNAVVGTYTLDVAQTKADVTMRMARNEHFPLRVKVEKHV